MKKQRKILLIHLGQAFGGIEVYLGNLAKLVRDDAELIAVCSHPHLIKCLQEQSVQVIAFPNLTGPLRGIRFLLAVLVLPFVVWRHQIDTVHINGHWETILLAPARMLGCRTISTRHQTWDIPLSHWWRAPKRTLSSMVYNFNAQFAQLVICVSEAVALEVRRVISEERIVVIPNWIAHQPHYLNRIKHQRKTRLLFVGRMVIFKGLHLLLEAIQGLPDVSLTVVGDGSMLADFQRQALGLDVTFAGFHKDVQHFYDSADIFVMPSLGLEGLPLVSLEAMSNGLPCLFSDLEVHKEITDSGRAAKLFRTGDVKDLRNQLELLINDEKQRESIARAGYERIGLLYTSQVAHAAYLKAFDLRSGAAFSLPSKITSDPVGC